MRIAKRLEALESPTAATHFAVTLSDSDRPLDDVEAEYNAQHGFDPNREWLHVRFIGVENERVH